MALGRWSLWRWVWLRGAGFAARPILALGSDAIVDALAAEHAADRAADAAHHRASAACEAALARAANQSIR
ncbi:MAG TPA: hypothetical protein VGC42_22935, partial [Kofleriaceae bacterium]